MNSSSSKVHLKGDNCFPSENKMADLNLQDLKMFFSSFLKTIRNLTETENTQQATENAVEILF
jgi:hypothetical protein